MKFLKHHLQNINSKFIFEGDTPRHNPEDLSQVERTQVHTACREECDHLSHDVEDGLTAPLSANQTTGNDTLVGQQADDDLSEDEDGPNAEAVTPEDTTEDTETPSPHTASIDGLRTQPGYDQTPEADFNEARDAVTTAITNGELTIPEDIADDPDAVNEWLAQQVDIKLEDHDTDPVARVDEILAGNDQEVSPAVRTQMAERIAQAQSSGEKPNNLITMLINLLKELGIDFDEDKMYIDENGNYDPYSGESRGSASNEGRTYNGEEYRGEFSLNGNFYGVDALKEQLRAYPARLASAEEVMKNFPAPEMDQWHGAILRNALNNEGFTERQPILLHNISTSTAALWIPGQGQATLHAATHGYGGVGNGSGSGSTPIGSFELYQMHDGGKFTSRMGVKGLEGKQANYQAQDVQDAYGVNPADIGNNNSDNRLIRVHQIRGRRTAGCTGLPEDVAARLDQAVTDYGGAAMERFVSDPTG